MLKSFKIITTFLIIFMLFMPAFVQATDVNMNLSVDNSLQNTTLENEITNESLDTLSPNETNYSITTPTMDALNELPEASLGLSNVINIILIVIGVLLILLGIAIIIRLKH